MVAEDIPLCSIEQIINSIEKEIKDGYIQSVYSLQFGYVVYSDPNISDWTKSELEDEIFYLVPSWVAQCIFSENPKIWNSDADEEVMKSNEDLLMRKLVKCLIILIPEKKVGETAHIRTLFYGVT